MPGPIAPSKVADAKAAQIPEEVFEAFNEMIAKHWTGSRSQFLQKHVAQLALDKIRHRINDMTLDRMYENKWFDVEDAFRKAGWIVKYDRPGYCESYEANFEFRKRGKR